ncbi:uncharacterized protein EDB91DRAFT_1110515 [Suillus paluster]|uniref:uncharacterized protein n=1 Tax=Suillus paluster TaxID=48578 RepID=UPI001B87D0BB|nr:uncharacterized protein EDB91DRAFT_1110515 [Suillus paluster]KAG1749946.1 hypothetical protein EDB91DRAFT_1110515 [Suillus paluster]
MVTSLFLWLLHLLHASLVFLTTRLQKRRYSPPQPVTAYRSKLPKHLAIVLVSGDTAYPKHTEELYLECLTRVIKWCRALGIEQLTAYDTDGVLLRCSDVIQERLARHDDLPTDESESELEYPLTPPLSEPSESRSHSPDLPVELNVTTVRSFQTHCKQREVAVRRRAHHKQSLYNPLTLHIISRSASKAAIASAARSLLDEEFRRRQNSHDLNHAKAYQLPISEFNSILEGGLPSPDFMIVHHIYPQDPQPPVELHGFPPWQITLTEIHRTMIHDVVGPLKYSHASSIITEEAFCHALDEYAGAQFRLGK